MSLSTNIHCILYLFLFQYSPYKAGSKRTLAERARELGLEKYATGVLEQPQHVIIKNAVQPGKKGKHLQHSL